MGKENTQKLKRRHHTVPRFYIRRFANERNHVMRIALPGTSKAVISVDDASVQKDFYLIEQRDGTKSDALEDSLGQIEAEAAKGLRKIIDGKVWPIPDEARWTVASWVAIQSLRTAIQRQSFNEIGDMLFKLQIGVGGKPQIRERMRDRLGREPTDAEVEDLWGRFSDFDSYSITPHQNGHLQNMLKLWPPTTNMLHDRSWTLIRFRRKALVTCDNPIYLSAGDDYPEWMGVGLATASEFVVPLDRRLALVIGDLDSPDRRIEGTSYLAKQINMSMAVNSQRAIFHHPDDNPLSGIELPGPDRRVMGGYGHVKTMIFPDGIGRGSG